MKFLVIGLGSMGKRRVRNLLALENKDIAGFDLRADRRNEAASKYGITVFSDLDTAIAAFQPDVFIISTPPDKHMDYAYLALQLKKDAFIEASVVDADKIVELDSLARAQQLMILPSCTMKFFPGPQKIAALLEQAVIGEVISINYHVGQYLPDWHPWENIADFYVSNKDTGAAREIVPFELTWLNGLFGKPLPVACVKQKRGDFSADIDDIYHSIMCYENGPILNLVVDVIARPVAVRSMRILGSKGIIEYEGSENLVRYINDKETGWIVTRFEEGTVEKEYIYSEEPYINEIKTFVGALNKRDATIYPNSLVEDANILKTLYALEKLA